MLWASLLSSGPSNSCGSGTDPSTRMRMCATPLDRARHTVGQGPTIFPPRPLADDCHCHLENVYCVAAQVACNETVKQEYSGQSQPGPQHTARPRPFASYSQPQERHMCDCGAGTGWCECQLADGSASVIHAVKSQVRNPIGKVLQTRTACSQFSPLSVTLTGIYVRGRVQETDVDPRCLCA